MSNKFYKIAEEIFFSAAIFRLSKGEKDIKLSNKEAELLEMLCDEAGSVIPRSKLQDALWPNQDNTDTNLNRQILSLRRKLESFGLMDAIDTIPRVGYIFYAPVEVVGKTEESAVPVDNQTASGNALDKYGRYFTPTRIILLVLLLSLTSLFLVRDKPDTVNIVRLRASTRRHISFYMAGSDSKMIDTLLPLIEHIPHYADERVFILVGKEAISYFSIDNRNQQLSENIFMLRNGRPIAEELQCVITTMMQQGKNVFHNNYHNLDSTVRYHSSCLAPDNWVEMRRIRAFIEPPHGKMVTERMILTDDKARKLLDLNFIGNLEHDNSNISVEVKNTIVNFIDPQLLTSNTMAVILAAELAQSTTRTQFLMLSNSIYFSSYLGGTITPVIQKRPE